METHRDLGLHNVEVLELNRATHARAGSPGACIRRIPPGLQEVKTVLPIIHAELLDHIHQDGLLSVPKALLRRHRQRVDKMQQ
jgi:hypothetical protein